VKAPTLTETERRQVVVEWNNTERNYPRECSLHEFIEDQVDRTPDAPALVFGSRQFSYQQLNARANRLAHYLRSRGVGPDVLVGVCAERSVEMVVALLAVMKAGGAYLPVDPAYPRERLAVMLQDAKPPVTITQDHLLGILPERDTQTICLNRDEPLLAAEPETNPPLITAAENLAYAMYTSGSTGIPKCVLNVHRAIVNRLLWMQDTYRLGESDRVLQKTPYSFDVSVWEFFWPLMTGACLVVAEPGRHKDPSYLVDIIARENITAIHFVPSLFHVFLEAPDVERCTSLRHVFCSGEVLSPALQESFWRRSKARLHNLYGPTEAAVDVTAWTCNPAYPRSIVPIGKPIWNTRIYILDSHLQPVPPGMPGQLHIGGVGLARGYLNRPELTAQKFIPDPFSPQRGARLYKTGDLARFLSDGNIEYLGRIDGQVKIRGIRIEPGEIEAALRSHPGIHQAAVVGRDEGPTGKRLVAYVVPRGQPVGIPELRELVQARLPEHMVPAAFVVLRALPLTASGKLDRNALPAPSAKDRKLRNGRVPPRSLVDLTLCQIWEDVLGLQSIGIDDNFHDLGGDSISAALTFVKIHQFFGKNLPVATLLHAATVRAIAEVLRSECRGSAPSLVALQAGGSRTPLFLVSGIGGNVVGFSALASHLGPDQPTYALQPPGIDGLAPYLTRIEDMASYYICEIKSRQPAGPYHLAGYSFGGTVVFEMAQQLRAQGDLVGLTALLDAQEWRYEKRMSGITYQAVLKQICFGPDRWACLRKAMRTHCASLICHGYSCLGRPVPQSLLTLQAVNRFAAERYVPRRYPGRLTLLRASSSSEPVADPLLGWGDLAGDGIDVRDIPGGHYEIATEPHVAVLAKELKWYLDRFAADALPDLARAAVGR